MPRGSILEYLQEGLGQRISVEEYFDYIDDLTRSEHDTLLKEAEKWWDENHESVQEYNQSYLESYTKEMDGPNNQSLIPYSQQIGLQDEAGPGMALQLRGMPFGTDMVLYNGLDPKDKTLLPDQKQLALALTKTPYELIKRQYDKESKAKRVNYYDTQAITSRSNVTGKKVRDVRARETTSRIAAQRELVISANRGLILAKRNANDAAAQVDELVNAGAAPEEIEIAEDIFTEAMDQVEEAQEVAAEVAAEMPAAVHIPSGEGVQLDENGELPSAPRAKRPVRTTIPEYLHADVPVAPKVPEAYQREDVGSMESGLDSDEEARKRAKFIDVSARRIMATGAIGEQIKVSNESMKAEILARIHEIRDEIANKSIVKASFFKEQKMSGAPRSVLSKLGHELGKDRRDLKRADQVLSKMDVDDPKLWSVNPNLNFDIYNKRTGFGFRNGWDPDSTFVNFGAFAEKMDETPAWQETPLERDLGAIFKEAREMPVVQPPTDAALVASSSYQAPTAWEAKKTNWGPTVAESWRGEGLTPVWQQPDAPTQFTLAVPLRDRIFPLSIPPTLVDRPVIPYQTPAVARAVQQIQAAAARAGIQKRPGLSQAFVDQAVAAAMELPANHIPNNAALAAAAEADLPGWAEDPVQVSHALDEAGGLLPMAPDAQDLRMPPALAATNVAASVAQQNDAGTGLISRITSALTGLRKVSPPSTTTAYTSPPVQNTMALAMRYPPPLPTSAYWANNSYAKKQALAYANTAAYAGGWRNRGGGGWRGRSKGGYRGGYRRRGGWASRAYGGYGGGGYRRKPQSRSTGVGRHQLTAMDRSRALVRARQYRNARPAGYFVVAGRPRIAVLKSGFENNVPANIIKPAVPGVDFVEKRDRRGKVRRKVIGFTAAGAGRALHGKLASLARRKLIAQGRY